MWADEIFQGEDTISYQLHWGDEQQEIVLSVQGVHNVSNSLAAIGIAHSLGISWEDIRQTLQKVKLTGMVPDHAYPSLPLLLLCLSPDHKWSTANPTHYYGFLL